MLQLMEELRLDNDRDVSAMKNVLWSEEEIRVSPDGFLFFVNTEQYSLDEEQPILLHTTSALLQELYPSRNIRDIFSRPGFVSEETVGCERCGKKFAGNHKIENDNPEVNGGKAIPTEYRIYQRLEPVENLPNRIHAALQDIRNFRHRVGGCRSDYSKKKSGKIRALQRQQNHLLRSNTEANSENSEARGPDAETRIEDGEEKPNREEFASANGGEDDTEEDEAIVVKLARTINSIRALFPHLLPVLNHERRSDKKLVIGNIRYKTKRNGAMCWLLGTESYGTCNLKRLNTAQDDIKHILESFIEIEVATEIARDPKGSPSYWSVQWIKDLVKHSNPAVPSPRRVLAVKTGVSEEIVNSRALSCDQMITVCDEASSEGMEQQYKKAVRKVQQRLSHVLESRFHGARLSIYGSCLSNLALGKGSDVDISLWIPEADKLKKDFDNGNIGAKQYDQRMRTFVFQVSRKLSKLQAEFRGMTPITKARIPVITGTYIYAGNPYTEDGSIDFDICFLNDIAVANSNLIREYSLVDSKVRSLMITVKQWAKEQKINSAKEKCISSYSWMNLVIFYLQCSGFLPNLQDPSLMKAAGVTPDRDGNYWHFVNNLDTCTLKWEEMKGLGLWVMPSDFDGLPVSLLLYGFFEFYGCRFPSGTHAVSIKRGEISLSKLATKKMSIFLSIEDPFETYDSFCPHDLGSPANAYGSAAIKKCLQEGEKHLRMLLSSEKSEGEKLWPTPGFVEPEPTRNNAKRSGFKRFDLPTGVVSDKIDPNMTLKGQPIVHTIDVQQRNNNRPKNRRSRSGRGRGRGGGRYGRTQYDRTRIERAPN